MPPTAWLLRQQVSPSQRGISLSLPDQNPGTISRLPGKKLPSVPPTLLFIELA